MKFKIHTKDIPKVPEGFEGYFFLEGEATYEEEDWEKDFDEKFTYKDDKNDHPRPEVCNGLMWGEVKSFIRGLLSKEREVIAGAIEMSKQGWIDEGRLSKEKEEVGEWRQDLIELGLTVEDLKAEGDILYIGVKEIPTEMMVVHTDKLVHFIEGLVSPKDRLEGEELLDIREILTDKK